MGSKHADYSKEIIRTVIVMWKDKSLDEIYSATGLTKQRLTWLLRIIRGAGLNLPTKYLRPKENLKNILAEIMAERKGKEWNPR